jgi:CheY-like chemotaxis protein
MLAGMLLPLGFRVREAASGRECLESVRDMPPDAVLLDISMDDMDGWETLRQLRAHGFDDLPVIMVSANAFENQSDRIAASGAQGFVDKPVIESELLAVLQRHLELEWVAELAVPAWTVHAPVPAATVVAEPLAIPTDQLQTVLQLARLGHARGVQNALDALVAHNGALEPQIGPLRACAARYAWGELIEHLTKALERADGAAERAA